MKKRLKKLIAIIIIFLFIINMFFSHDVNASGFTSTIDQPFGEISNHQSESGESSLDSITETGESPIQSTGEKNPDRKETVENSPSLGGSVAALLAELIAALAGLVNKLMSTLVNIGTDRNDAFTIQSLLKGEYPIFDINIFNIESSSESLALENTMNILKSNIARWYYSIRSLVIAASMLTLIYIGIRMATSTLVPERVKYKKMLKNWVVAFILLFAMHFLVLFIINLSNILIDLLSNVLNEDSFEVVLSNDLWIMIQSKKGWDKATSLIMYIILVYYQLKFFIIYFKRVLNMSILSMIGPLVCLTYPIDKVGDNKAQAFKAWFMEIIITVVIHPIHLIVYIVFVYSAGEIFKVQPAFGILFFTALTRAEGIIRSSFKLGEGDLKKIHLKNFIPGTK